ncbi:uncharacterized protein LOC142320961 [Lycorma delicatula]|uniref:uncharacterized protein LOC142320961 n=1 Tax=Lycorma delicatula TaxID=130591 RepID=UPI003F5171F5
MLNRQDDNSSSSSQNKEAPSSDTSSNVGGKKARHFSDTRSDSQDNSMIYQIKQIKDKRENKNKIIKGPRRTNNYTTTMHVLSHGPIPAYIERESFILITGLITLVAMYIGTVIRYLITGGVDVKNDEPISNSEANRKLPSVDYQTLRLHIYRLLTTTFMITAGMFCVFGLMSVQIKLILKGQVNWPKFKVRLCMYTTCCYFLLTLITQFIPYYSFSSAATENYIFCIVYFILALLTLEGFLIRLNFYNALNSTRSSDSPRSPLFR